jgi:hypothetical protein
MDCVVHDAASVRTLARLVQCAARIGDEVTFTATRDSLRVRTLNASHSACAEFVLLRPFFAAFSTSAPASFAAGKGGGGATGSSPCARVPARALLPIFRAPATIERVRIALRGGSGNDEDRGGSAAVAPHLGADALIITVRARSAVRKAFRVPVLSGHAPHAVYARDGTAGCLHARPRFLIDVLANFHARLDEITFTPTLASLKIASFVDDSAKPQSNILRTEMAIDHREFDLFRVPEQRAAVSLTFYFKPFRAVLDLCEHFDAPLVMSFHDSGHPVLFSIELAAPGAAKHFEATFIFATRIVQESDTLTPNTPSTSDATTGRPQVSPAASDVRANSQRRRTPSLTLSQRQKLPPLPTAKTIVAAAGAPSSAEGLAVKPLAMLRSSSSSPVQSQLHNDRFQSRQVRPTTADSETGANVQIGEGIRNAPVADAMAAINKQTAIEDRVHAGQAPLEMDDEYVEGTPPPSP